MLLSIIIPYFNADPWIGAMLDSLLDQDLSAEDYEIIVVDDGSTEEALTLQRYVAQYPSLIRYVRQENAGVSAARNTGIGLAKGDWLYFCDSDDQVQPQVLGSVLAIAESSQLEMIFGNVRLANPDETVSDPHRRFEDLSPLETGFDYLGNHPVMRAYGPSCYLTRRTFLEEKQLRFEPYAYAEDRFFLLKALFAARRVREVDVDFYYYIQRESSIVHAIRRQYYAEKIYACLRAYVEWLSGRIGDAAIPEAARTSLVCWRDACAYYMLLDLFRYAPVSLLKDCLDLLAACGAYPLQIRGDRESVRIRRWMNCRPLWMLGARLYHLLPSAVRTRR